MKMASSSNDERSSPSSYSEGSAKELVTNFNNKRLSEHTSQIVCNGIIPTPSSFELWGKPDNFVEEYMSL